MNYPTQFKRTEFNGGAAYVGRALALRMEDGTELILFCADADDAIRVAKKLHSGFEYDRDRIYPAALVGEKQLSASAPAQPGLVRPGYGEAAPPVERRRYLDGGME